MAKVLFFLTLCKNLLIINNIENFVNFDSFTAFDRLKKYSDLIRNGVLHTN